MLLGSILYDELVQATGTASLADVILEAADAEIGVEEVFGYWVEEGKNPKCIASSGRVGSSAARASLYSDRYFQLDPLVWLAAGATEGGPARFGRLTPNEVQNPVYRRDCYEHPGFGEKLSFACRRDNRHYVLSFYRSQQRRPAQRDSLVPLADLVLPLLRKHAELLGDRVAAPLELRVEGRLARAYPHLTRREKEVCARTIIGMTSEAIGLDLGISANTVLTYRRRAYDRCGVSGAQSMIGSILD